MEKTRINIAQATPGMKLADPIANAAGIALMPAGIRLTPMFIERIKKWSIEEIEVQVDTVHADDSSGTSVRRKAGPGASARISDGSVPAAQEQFARAVAAEVAKVFANVRDNPLMMQLRAVAIRRLVAKGPDSVIGSLRRGPLDEVPLPAGEGV